MMTETLAKAKAQLESDRHENKWRTKVRHIDLSQHHTQRAFIESAAKRKVVRAGRRGGKTTGAAELAVRAFEAGRRILYATPTQEQVEAFWFQVKWALEDGIDSGALYKNETEKVIEVAGTKNRLRAKTAWNADTLRGDYADLLILDEYQLMSEDAWGRVGAPMLMDNNGDAVFIYTPPSLHARSTSKARDPQHAAKLFKHAAADESGRWQTFHWTSRDNPAMTEEAVTEIAADMTALAQEQEIEALDKDESPGALWKREIIERFRVQRAPDLVRIMEGVDPPGGVTECGIVAAGLGVDGHGYVLADASLRASPEGWASAAVGLYHELEADKLLGEKNFGGDMVERTIRTVEGGAEVRYKDVSASRGKAVRAEPVAALYERGRVHHVGTFPQLEDEQCMWEPGMGMPSPNRVDALVWALTELMVKVSGPGMVKSRAKGLYEETIDMPPGYYQGQG